jgi:predicted MPP superfamily phosphohydrolase
MTELYPVFFATAVIFILSGIVILFFRLLNRRWWQKRWIRRSSLLLPLAGMVAILVWTLGIFALKKTVMIIGSSLAALSMVLILALLLSLPISGIINFINDWIEKREKKSRGEVPVKAEPDATSMTAIPRRKFLKGAAAVVPVAALSTGISGVAHAFTDIKVYHKPVVFNNLPPQLEGLKILHLSDIHIGYYVWLEHVATALEAARAYKPDLILATGDLSDRLDVYGDLLDMIYRFDAPLGVYASLGNHEYYRGIKQVLKIFSQSPVPLLVNDGAVIEWNGYPVYLAGADDPRYLSRKETGFFKRTIDAAMTDVPSGAFSILMSHRPEGFDYAAETGVDLTLAGHHHGTQIGFGGRSVFEEMMPKKYLWGVYEKGPSRLYTSAGVGHWFPFRLGCPAEAPVLELTSRAAA